MNDAVAMSIAQSVDHLSKHRYRANGAHWSAVVYLIAQQFARDEFHHEVIRTVVFAEGVQPRKIRMVEPRHGDCLLKEPLFDLLIASVLFVEFFYSDDAARCVGVLGLEDRAEAAAPDVIGDLISANASAAHIDSKFRDRKNYDQERGFAASDAT